VGRSSIARERALRASFRSVAVLFVVMLVAGFAGAQGQDETADQLFVRARTFMKEGNCEAALPLLVRSHELDPTLGTRLNIAICESRTGRLTQAAEHLRSVVDESAPNDDRRVHAERALGELLPRIPRLIVELDTGSRALELVRLDGESLSGLKANEPYPVNPGSHVLEVTLVGEASQRRRFSVAERSLYTWSLASTNSAPVEALSAAPAEPPADAAEPPAAPFWTMRRKASVVAAGTSVAAFAVATGFAVSAKSLHSSTDCSASNVCDDPDDVDARDRARAHGRIATVAATVGLSAALASVTLWLTGDPPAPTAARALRVGVGGSVALGSGSSRGASLVLEAHY